MRILLALLTFLTGAAAQEPAVKLPPELSRVLTDYEAAWRGKDAAALARLFTEDGIVLSSGTPMVRGRAAIEKHYQGAGGPLFLSAVAYGTAGERGFIVGRFRTKESGGMDAGKFTLTLRREKGKWLIFSDMDNGNGRAANEGDKKRMTAKGTFDVKVAPLPAGSEQASQAGLVRLSLNKQFHGELDGASIGEMMASNAGTEGSGGYVAIERFTGTLHGKRGSFSLQHSGVMAPGMMEIQIRMSPGSGTDELAGISGTMTIKIEEKKHFYELTYSLD